VNLKCVVYTHFKIVYIFKFHNIIIKNDIFDTISPNLLPFLKLNFELPSLVIKKNAQNELILIVEIFVDGEYETYR
jgi:hypothetical protein